MEHLLSYLMNRLIDQWLCFGRLHVVIVCFFVVLITLAYYMSFILY